MSVDTSAVQGLADALDDADEDVDQAVAEALAEAMSELADAIARTSLSGQVLNARTGTLRASLQTAASAGGAVTLGSIYSDVPYAAIHEYGGVIERVARHQAEHGRRLRGQGGDYRIVEPEQSYLRSNLSDRAADISDDLTDAAMEALPL